MDWHICDLPKIHNYAFQEVCTLAGELFYDLGHSLMDPHDVAKKANKFGSLYKQAGFIEDITPYIHSKSL